MKNEEGGGVWVQLLEGQGAMLELFLFYVNVSMPSVSYILPTFDDTDSQGSPPRKVVYPPG